MMLKPATWAWAAVALALVAVVHGTEPPQAGAGGFVSTRSSARRVFPTLPDITMQTASITLARAGGASVVLQPSGDGHALLVDGEVVGPADPRAVEGLWASLRMATTVRAVSDDAGVGVGSLGTVTVQAAGVSRTLRVGGRTPDDAGRYAEIDNADFDPQGPRTQIWVVEAEMADILDQAPEAWLSRRAVLVEPGQVLALKLPGGQMQRGEDGRWRSSVGEDHPVSALLSTDAVEARLGRMVGARLSPLLPEGAPQTPTPWVSLEGTGARRWTLALAGACPDGSARTVLMRGAGWPGCVDQAISGTWPLPGTGSRDAGALLEPRLSPYGYGRVLRLEQRLPARQALSRHAGDWRLSTADGDRMVDGPDVFAWYEAVHDAEVELAPLGTAVPSWAVDLEMTTDTTQRMRLRCGPRGPGRICRRDEGPLLRLRSSDVTLATDAATFADRDLLRFVVDDVRALEVTAAGRPRQSVHFDLGVWRLDAPTHPEGDSALSDVLLGEVLAAAASLRVRSWVPLPAVLPLRTLRLEQVPEAGRDTVFVVEVWADPEDPQGCIAAVDQRAGRLSATACRRLQQDVLHTDPVQFWLDTARSIEVTINGHTSRFERTREGLVGEGPEVEADMERLRALAQRRVLRLESASDNSMAEEGTWSIRVLPKRGERLGARIGGNVLVLDGAGWRYRLAPPG
ncbi:MAG: DUF4340 domain-containing protein [Nannocystaceae bacterium]|nr:DUF4340 domain-containing protein [Nannocystaceae bacterium]